MSLSRIGEDGEWFDTNPGYVYVADTDRFNIGIHTVPHFCEMSMRALAQSGELDDEQLAACEQALRERFSYAFEEQEE